MVDLSAAHIAAPAAGRVKKAGSAHSGGWSSRGDGVGGGRSDTELVVLGMDGIAPDSTIMQR